MARRIRPQPGDDLLESGERNYDVSSHRRPFITSTPPSVPNPGSSQNLKRTIAFGIAAITHRFDLVLALLLTVLAIFLGTNLFSPVRFDKEKIEVWVADGQIQVRGLYHYRNRTLLPVSFSLGLPFPVDADHPAPSAFSVAEVDAAGEPMASVNVRTYHGNYVFRLIFWPKQQKWIRLDYIQPTLAESGTYILQTTRKWHQPLDSGEYILHLDNGLSLATSTYAIAQVSTGNQNTYSFSRAYFYPGEDWSFTWQRETHIAALRRDHP
jgi:hypothetical protein